MRESKIINSKKSNKEKRKRRKKAVSKERLEFFIVRNKFESAKPDIIPTSQIIKRFNLNYSLTYNLIKDARKSGIFKISLNQPEISKLEDELKVLLSKPHKKLKDLFIAEIDNQEQDLSRALSEAASFYINRLIKNVTIIVISGGATVYSWTSSFKPYNSTKEESSIEICPINADLKTIPEVVHASINADRVYKHFLKTPGYRYENVTLNKFDITEITERSYVNFHMSKCENCKHILEKIKKSDMIITGIEDLNTESTFWQVLKHYDIDPSKLKDKGIVGNVAFRAFTLDGKIIPTGLEKYLISINPTEMRLISNKKIRKYFIGIAGGLDKVNAIIGAARSGLINILITDEITAKELKKRLTI